LELERYLLPFRGRRLPLYRFDVVVLGAGVAGSTAALAAAEDGAEVALIAKDSVEESNTLYAQGGVAAVLGADDSVAAHVADTLEVGCGLCDEDLVEEVIAGGPAAIADLVRRGAEFDRNADGGLHLSREGGHSRARIAHSPRRRDRPRDPAHARARDARRRLHRDLRAHLRARPARGRARPHRGVLCQTRKGEQVVFGASQVVLATGGAGQIYRETTNPAIATGDGVAMAFRAGARMRDLEFFQFHPTCLYIAGAARVLISEIVRGAGGILRDKSGARFMPEYHPSAELAPRDVVSRACFDRMVRTATPTSIWICRSWSATRTSSSRTSAASAASSRSTSRATRSRCAPARTT
jgi:L-aspartate oxidase